MGGNVEVEVVLGRFVQKNKRTKGQKDKKTIIQKDKDQKESLIHIAGPFCTLAMYKKKDFQTVQTENNNFYLQEGDIQIWPMSYQKAAGHHPHRLHPHPAPHHHLPHDQLLQALLLWGCKTKSTFIEWSNSDFDFRWSQSTWPWCWFWQPCSYPSQRTSPRHPT